MQRITNMEKIDSGSNYNFPDKLERPNNPRSVFNLSHLVTMTISNGGVIFPIDWFEYIPGDSFSIAIRHILRVMPQVVPLFSRQRIFIHAFAMNYGDLQSDFQTLMTKGYSGNVIKKIAPLTSSNIDSEIYNSGDGVVTPDSLADYLGLPQGQKYSDLISSGISALPFLMYESIYKNYYMNRNYYIDNRNWLPDDPESFRLDENGVLASNTDNDHPKVYFGKLHYRDYPDDYFTSCLPFAQRGDRPLLSAYFKDSNIFDNVKLGVYGTTYKENGGDTPIRYAPIGQQYLDVATTIDDRFSIGQLLINKTGADYPNDLNLQIGAFDSSKTRATAVANQAAVETALGQSTAQALNAGLKATASLGIGLEELRQLARQQIELEKAARTDGSYAEFGLTFFNVKPATSKECKPLYIGGTYSSISFTEVLQTSASSESSALGQIAGHGLSVDNRGFIGNFNATDFGIIMLVGTIMPDVYYSQGLEKKWSRKYQSEFYLPERSKMGLQPVTNKEIYFTGNSESDDDLFGYQNPFDDFRYQQNRICGKIADSSNLSFSPFTQARQFESLPTLSQSFAIADDVRKDYLFAPLEDAYTAQFSLDIRAVRPLPYKPIPSNFGF